jgi:hypothetical protein
LFKIATFLVFAIGAATAAAAEATSPGAAMLARLLGVAPGAYSVAELIQLQAARDENDVEATNHVLKRGTAVEVTRPASFVMADKGSPAALTLNQEVRLARAAREDGNDEALDLAVLRHEIAGTRPFPAAHVSPGEEQIAASLGVDPAKFTLSELVRMAPARSDDD